MVNVNHRRTPAIYALHTGDHIYHYVGATTVNSDNRLYEHIYRANSGHTAPVYAWMREVGIRNVQVIDLEAIIDADSKGALEAHWIARMISEGHPLSNQIARDGIPDSMSAESKGKISRANSGKDTWTKGKRGIEAGWTDKRRADCAARAKPKPEPKPPYVRVPKHGTRSEYDRYKCKCYECRLVGAQRNAARRGSPIPTALAQ